MAETANVTPEPDSLMGSAVAKKFPGFGKELWDGEIVDGPDPKGRWCVYWARDDSTTWHSRSMLEKILTRRGPAADDDAPAAAEPAAAAAAATTEMPPLPPETPREAMPPLPPPTPTEAASLQQPPKKKAPYKCTKCGQAKKSDCVCPKKPPAPRGKKKSKLPETDEPLEAIESRFLGEDEDQRELEACRERKGALDEEAARLKRELAETRAAQAQAPPAAPEKKKPKKRPPKKAFEVGSIVDADCKAFGPQYVEAARNGGPKKFRGVIVATPPNSDHWNVEYVDDGETFATESKHLTLVSEPTKKKAKPNEVCVVCGLPTVDEDGRPQDDVILCADDVSHECHLKCSGITAGSANSMNWRCPRCDIKKCQELSLQENDLTSPWVGLEAHRLVRELVKGLQREYKQLLVSGQRIDENTHDVTLSHADACELYGKAVFWEGASADLTARGGLLYSQLEVGEAEDWRRKPRSISLFPSGRVVKTVECLAAWKSTRVSGADFSAVERYLEDQFRGRIQKACASFYPDTSPPLPIDQAANILVQRWLDTCEEATRQVDDRRKRVTAELGSSVRDDQAWGVRLAYLADTASDHGAALRGGAGVSNGRGDVLATLDDGPFRVAEVYCAKDSAIRLPIRADVLERLLKRFRRAQDAADEAIGKEKETKKPVTSVQEPLVQKAGRIPKKRKRTQTSEEHTARPAHFLSHVYSMLLRYDDLSGEAGQHGAIPPQVFDVLKKWGCAHECCATPFNATLDSYGSPFLDTDGVFGSAGSFFAFEPVFCLCGNQPDEGCFEINPPFTLSGNHVSDHMGRILQRAEDARKPLTFVMVHAAPHARVAREAGLQRFVREEVRLEGGRHYYLEGNFYQRAQPRAYVPPFPSVVLFFSTTEGSKRWPVTRSLVDDIKKAFAWPRVKSKPVRPSAMLPVPSRPSIKPPDVPSWPAPAPAPPARPDAVWPAAEPAIDPASTTHEMAPGGWQTVMM